jgi:hypothetical protein
LRSPSNVTIEAFTASSVNSGNSFKQCRKVTTSCASNPSCFGKSSGSGGSRTTGRRACGGARCLPRRREVGMAGLLSDSFGGRETLRGNKSAAFSRNRYSMIVNRSRRLNIDERIPTEEPSCRAALEKLRSSLSRILTCLLDSQLGQRFGVMPHTSETDDMPLPRLFGDVRQPWLECKVQFRRAVIK